MLELSPSGCQQSPLRFYIFQNSHRRPRRCARPRRHFPAVEDKAVNCCQSMIHKLHMVYKSHWQLRHVWCKLGHGQLQTINLRCPLLQDFKPVVDTTIMILPQRHNECQACHLDNKLLLLSEHDFVYSRPLDEIGQSVLIRGINVDCLSRVRVILCNVRIARARPLGFGRVRRLGVAVQLGEKPLMYLQELSNVEAGRRSRVFAMPHWTLAQLLSPSWSQIELFCLARAKPHSQDFWMSLAKPGRFSLLPPPSNVSCLEINRA